VDLKKNQLPVFCFLEFPEGKNIQRYLHCVQLKKKIHSALLFHKHGEKKIMLRDFVTRNSPVTSRKFEKLAGR